MKRIGLTLMIIFSIFVIIGCQKDVVEKAGTLVGKAEKQASQLKSQTKYKAFSLPSETLIKDTETAYQKAKGSIKDVKDESQKSKFQNRIYKVKTIIDNINDYISAVNSGNAFNESKKQFLAYVSANVMSADLDSKLADFQKSFATAEKVKDGLKDDDFQSAYDTHVLADTKTVVDSVQKVISARNGVNDLAKLIASNPTKEVLDKKIEAVKTLVSAVTDKAMQTALSNKQTEIAKPYLAKLDADAKKQQELASATTSTSTSSSSTSSSTTKSTSGTTSKTTTTASKPSTSGSTSSSSGGSTTPPAGQSDLFYKVFAVCTKVYGYTTRQAPHSVDCNNGTHNIFQTSGTPLVGGDKRYCNPKVIADVGVALGFPMSSSEVLSHIQAGSSYQSADGKTGIYFNSNKVLVTLQW